MAQDSAIPHSPQPSKRGIGRLPACSGCLEISGRWIRPPAPPARQPGTRRKRTCRRQRWATSGAGAGIPVATQAWDSSGTPDPTATGGGAERASVRTTGPCASSSSLDARRGTYYLQEGQGLGSLAGECRRQLRPLRPAGRAPAGRWRAQLARPGAAPKTGLRGTKCRGAGGNAGEDEPDPLTAGDRPEPPRPFQRGIPALRPREISATVSADTVGPGYASCCGARKNWLPRAALDSGEPGDSRWRRCEPHTKL